MPEYATSLVKSEVLEAAMLNRLINDRYAPLQVMHLLNSSCFDEPVHRTLFKAISELYTSGIEVSETSVAEQLYGEVAKSRDGARPSFLMTFRPDLTLISPYIALPSPPAIEQTPEQKVLGMFRAKN